jgi:flagellar hook-associated protein 1 FlgK
MLNSFSGVASAPTDLSARTVALTSADEMASRFRTASSSLNDLQTGTKTQLNAAVTAVNTLAGQIAAANEQIARTQGSGQPPNDLLDRRDQLIHDLNQYVQTTSIAASDGTVGVFLAGSQPLVLGTTVSPVALTSDTFSDPSTSKLTIKNGGMTTVLDETTLGGGQISGLLKFQNTDLVDARNQLGRMALAIGTAANDQHKLGVDLNNNPGKNLFSLSAIPNGLAASDNKGTATLQVTIQTTPTSGTTTMAASNYQVTFTSTTAGSITRLSDGKVTTFASAPPLQIDGLNIAISAGSLASGDRFLITPFTAAASNINTAIKSPELAMSSPVTASVGTSNLGTLAVASLTTRSVPAPAAMTLTFTAAGTYTRSDDPNLLTTPPGTPTAFTYTPGQAIESTFPVVPAASPLTGWSLTLTGTPVVGDVIKVGSNATVQPKTNPQLNADNGKAMMALRDVAMFEGATLTDGYASVMTNIGVRVQAATSIAAVSKSIATNADSARAGVAGVNLDEEAAKLLQYQQAYQASAKMLQIAQSVFTSLMAVFP